MNRMAFTVASAFLSVVSFGCESTPPLSPTPTATVGAATGPPSFGLAPPGSLLPRSEHLLTHFYKRIVELVEKE